MTYKEAQKTINRGASLPVNTKNTLRASYRELIDLDGWRDLTMPAQSAALGPSAPSLTAFGPTGNIKQLAFGVGDSVYFIGHVDHDWKVGSDAFFHIHWATSGTSTNTVKWEINYSVAKGFDQEAFPEETQRYIEEAASATPWQHTISEETVATDLKETDSLFLVEIKRVTNGAVDNGDTVFLLTCDLHYQVGQIATPQKAPDFFALS